MKNLFSITIFFAFLLQFEFAYSQQDPMYSLYLHDKVLINPAYAGSSNWIVGTLKYRTQFIGMPGAPVTQTFNFHAPVQKKHVGFGLKVIHDKIAVINSTTATGIFSYHLGLAGGKLSLGVEGGIFNQNINFPDLIKKDPIDNSLSEGTQSLSVLDAAFGIYYRKKNFSLGFSETHLPNSKLRYGIAGAPEYAHLYSHHFLYATYGFDLSDKVYLEPSALLKSTVGASVQCDFNTCISFSDKFSFGISFRSGDAVCCILKANITEQLRLAYSYDYTISKLSSYSSGAHEIMLSYGIKLLPPAAEKEVHPRFYF